MSATGKSSTKKAVASSTEVKAKVLAAKPKRPFIAPEDLDYKVDKSPVEILKLRAKLDAQGEAAAGGESVEVAPGQEEAFRPTSLSDLPAFQHDPLYFAVARVEARAAAVEADRLKAIAKRKAAAAEKKAAKAPGDSKKDKKAKAPVTSSSDKTGSDTDADKTESDTDTPARVKKAKKPSAVVENDEMRKIDDDLLKLKNARKAIADKLRAEKNAASAAANAVAREAERKQREIKRKEAELAAHAELQVRKAEVLKEIAAEEEAKKAAAAKEKEAVRVFAAINSESDAREAAAKVATAAPAEKPFSPAEMRARWQKLNEKASASVAKAKAAETVKPTVSAVEELKAAKLKAMADMDAQIEEAEKKDVAAKAAAAAAKQAAKAAKAVNKARAVSKEQEPISIARAYHEGFSAAMISAADNDAGPIAADLEIHLQCRANHIVRTAHDLYGIDCSRCRATREKTVWVCSHEARAEGCRICNSIMALFQADNHASVHPRAAKALAAKLEGAGLPSAVASYDECFVPMLCLRPSVRLSPAAVIANASGVIASAGAKRKRETSPKPDVIEIDADGDGEDSDAAKLAVALARSLEAAPEPSFKRRKTPVTSDAKAAAEVTLEARLKADWEERPDAYTPHQCTVHPHRRAFAGSLMPGHSCWECTCHENGIAVFFAKKTDAK